MRTMVFLMLAVAQAFAQYFGRNKVRYERFDFNVLETVRFRILYYPAESLAVNRAARMAQRWQRRLYGIFATTLPERQSLILYANHANFQQTNAIPGLIRGRISGMRLGTD